MKVVKFTTHCQPYNSGEQAGFPDAMADSYVARGIAEHVKPEKVEKASSRKTPDPAVKPGHGDPLPSGGAAEKPQNQGGFQDDLTQR